MVVLERDTLSLELYVEDNIKDNSNQRSTSNTKWYAYYLYLPHLVRCHIIVNSNNWMIAAICCTTNWLTVGIYNYGYVTSVTSLCICLVWIFFIHSTYSLLFYYCIIALVWIRYYTVISFRDTLFRETNFLFIFILIFHVELR